jgi:hypothetical protein
LEELSNLKLALATFALHLDAFEARVRGGPLRADVKSAANPQPDIDFAKKIVSAMRNPSSTVTANRP